MNDLLSRAHAALPIYLPPPYPGTLPRVPLVPRPHTGQPEWQATRDAQGGKGEELQRAREKVGEEEDSTREGAKGAAGAQTYAQSTPGVEAGEAQAIGELHHAWAAHKATSFAEIRRRYSR